MSDYLSRIDRETWFSQAPSHPLPHASLVEARIDADLAWKDYDEVIEREIHADTWELRPPDYKKVAMYLELAEAAEAKYSKLFDELNGAK